MHVSKVKVTLVLDVPVTTSDKPDDITVSEWKKILTYHVRQILDPSDWTSEEASKAIRDYKIIKTEKN